MEPVQRTLTPSIREDLARKIVLVTGPRQSGKTTLARAITAEHEHINYDYAPHRTLLKERSWDRTRKLLVLDELHKMRGGNRGSRGSTTWRASRPGCS
jgi:uncharacterized protein